MGLQGAGHDWGTKGSTAHGALEDCWWLSSKESACSMGDLGSIPGWGRSSGEGNGNPLKYSCLENSMVKGAWQSTVHGVEGVGHDWATYTHTHTHKVPLDFPWWLSCKECRFNPWDGKIPWWRKWQPTPVFLPGKSHGQRSLAGYHPWGHRVRYDLATRQQHGALYIVDTCYDLNVRVSPNLTWWISYWRCDVITRWGLERNSDHEGGALLNWINVFIKETPERSLTLATVWRPNEKV